MSHRPGTDAARRGQARPRDEAGCERRIGRAGRAKAPPGPAAVRSGINRLDDRIRKLVEERSLAWRALRDTGTRAFAAPGVRAHLVLLSDGVEESGLLDLSRRPLDAAGRRAALERARAEGLVPALAGVETRVVGAGGRHYASVEAF